MNGSDDNPVLKWMMNGMSKSLPQGFVHSCPFVGLMKAYNVSFSADGVISQFLRGRYKNSARVFDDNDDNIITSKTVIELK